MLQFHNDVTRIKCCSFSTHPRGVVKLERLVATFHFWPNLSIPSTMNKSPTFGVSVSQRYIQPTEQQGQILLSLA